MSYRFPSLKRDEREHTHIQICRYEKGKAENDSMLPFTHLQTRATALQPPPHAHEAVHAVQDVIIAEHAAGKEAGAGGRFILQDLECSSVRKRR